MHYEFVPLHFLILSRLRVLGGGLSPMAEKSLAALPEMSVRTHIVWERTFTGMALTSASSRMASTTVRGLF